MMLMRILTTITTVLEIQVTLAIRVISVGFLTVQQTLMAMVAVIHLKTSMMITTG